MGKKLFLLVLLFMMACQDEPLMIPHDYSQPCDIESWGEDYVLSINGIKWHQQGYFDTTIALYYPDTIYITSYGYRLRAFIGGVMNLDTVHNGYYSVSIPRQ